MSDKIKRAREALQDTNVPYGDMVAVVEECLCELESRAADAKEIERLKDLIARYEASSTQSVIDYAKAISRHIEDAEKIRTLTADIARKAEAAAKEITVRFGGRIDQVAAIITAVFTEGSGA